MNQWQYEQYKQMDEFSRQRIVSEVKAEKLVQQLRIYHPGMFARMMFRLANWMIAKGQGLRRRYEIPSAHHSQGPSRNLI
jgi:hypothetical protein